MTPSDNTVLERENSGKVMADPLKMCLKKLPVLRVFRMSHEDLLKRVDQKGISLSPIAKEELITSSTVLGDFGKTFGRSTPVIFSFEQLGNAEEEMCKRVKDLGLSFYSRREVLELACQYNQPEGESFFIVMPGRGGVIVFRHDDRGRFLDSRNSLYCSGSSQLLLKLPIQASE